MGPTVKQSEQLSRHILRFVQNPHDRNLGRMTTYIRSNKTIELPAMRQAMEKVGVPKESRTLAQEAIKHALVEQLLRDRRLGLTSNQRKLLRKAFVAHTRQAVFVASVKNHPFEPAMKEHRKREKALNQAWIRLGQAADVEKISATARRIGSQWRRQLRTGSQIDMVTRCLNEATLTFETLAEFGAELNRSLKDATR